MTQHTQSNGVHSAILLLGGGGHAAVVADAARGAGIPLAGYVDDRAPESARDRLAGLNYLGVIDDVPTILATTDRQIALHAAVGDNALRRQWLGQFSDHAIATIVHHSAVIAPDAELQPGCFVGPRAVINSRASIGRGAIVNSAAIIEHDCVVGSMAHVAPGAVVCGNVSIGSEALIGVAAAVIPGRNIGEGATIAAGAVVINDVDAHATVVGCPARTTSRSSIEA